MYLVGELLGLTQVIQNGGVHAGLLLVVHGQTLVMGLFGQHYLACTLFLV